LQLALLIFYLFEGGERKFLLNKQKCTFNYTFIDYSIVCIIEKSCERVNLSTDLDQLR